MSKNSSYEKMSMFFPRSIAISAYDKEAWANYINVFDLVKSLIKNKSFLKKCLFYLGIQDSFEDADLVRRLEKLRNLGESALPDEQESEF